MLRQLGGVSGERNSVDKGREPQSWREKPLERLVNHLEGLAEARSRRTNS